MASTNYLHGVFWDYPQYTSEDTVVQTLERSQGQGDTGLYRWMMVRFLEYGRVVDTLRFFSIGEITEHLPELRVRPYTRKKWQRLIEVYRAS